MTAGTACGERSHSSRGHLAQSPPHRGHLIFPNKLPQGCVLAPLLHQGNLAKNPFQHSFPSPTAGQGCCYSENSLIQMHSGSENTHECPRWTPEFSPWDRQRTKATIKKCTNTVRSREEYTTPPASSRRAQQVPQGEEGNLWQRAGTSLQRWACCDLGAATSACGRGYF